MGKIIYEEIKEHEISEESLRREYKEAKELYIKHKKNIDLENVILRPWQEALLEYIKPTNRERKHLSCVIQKIVNDNRYFSIRCGKANTDHVYLYFNDKNS